MPKKSGKVPRASRKQKQTDEATIPDLPDSEIKVGCTNGWLKQDYSDQRGASEVMLKR